MDMYMENLSTAIMSNFCCCFPSKLIDFLIHGFCVTMVSSSNTSITFFFFWVLMLLFFVVLYFFLSFFILLLLLLPPVDITRIADWSLLINREDFLHRPLVHVHVAVLEKIHKSLFKQTNQSIHPSVILLLLRRDLHSSTRVHSSIVSGNSSCEWSQIQFHQSDLVEMCIGLGLGYASQRHKSINYRGCSWPLSWSIELEDDLDWLTIRQFMGFPGHKRHQLCLSL